MSDAEPPFQPAAPSQAAASPMGSDKNTSPAVLHVRKGTAVSTEKDHVKNAVVEGEAGDNTARSHEQTSSYLRSLVQTAHKGVARARTVLSDKVADTMAKTADTTVGDVVADVIHSAKQSAKKTKAGAIEAGEKMAVFGESIATHTVAAPLATVSIQAFTKGKLSSCHYRR
jgi:hypothetical protein